MNETLVSGLNWSLGLVLDGQGQLFVVNYGSGTVGKYTTAGEVINPSLVVAPGKIAGLAVVLVPPPPALQISHTPNQVVLSWPASASNFVLQTTSTLSPGATWLPLTNGVVANADSFVLTNQIGPSSAFYRLHQP